MAKASSLRALRSSGKCLTHRSLPYHRKRQTESSRGSHVRALGSHEGVSDSASIRKLHSGDEGVFTLPGAHTHVLTEDLDVKFNSGCIEETRLQQELDAIAFGKQLTNDIRPSSLIEATDDVSPGSLRIPSPAHSTASTILDESMHGIFGGVPMHSNIDAFKFEFDRVIKVSGGKSQVKWADSIVHKSDLDDRTLHGEPLRNSVCFSKPLGGGLSKVEWLSTWEPTESLQVHTVGP